MACAQARPQWREPASPISCVSCDPAILRRAPADTSSRAVIVPHCDTLDCQIPFTFVGFHPGSWHISERASGQSSGDIKHGEIIGLDGTKSTIFEQQSDTSDQVSNGGFNSDTASSDTQSQDTPLGNSTSSNTDAKSVQGTNSAFSASPSFGGVHNLPVIPSGLGFGSAQGQAGSNIANSDNIGSHDGTSTTTQRQFSTSDQARNVDDFNSGTASNDTQSLNTPNLINTDGKPVQRPALAFPAQ